MRVLRTLLKTAAVLTLSCTAAGMVPAQQYGATQYGGFGSQPFATGQPYQSDPVGSSYQSMSPDSWGSSAPAGPDPFSTPAAPGFAGPGLAPAPQATVYSTPTQNYESTAAPSVETVLGRSNQNRTMVAPPNPNGNRPTFRRADFDQNDPRDLPLAPTVPGSILDGNAPAAQQNANGPQGRTPTLDGPNLTAPNGLAPPQRNGNGNLPATVEGALNPPGVPNSTPPPASPTTPVAPGQPTITPYQMPQVFQQPPMQPAPLTFAPQQPIMPAVQAPVDSGFGWGNAPGLFDRSPQQPAWNQPPAQSLQQGPNGPTWIAPMQPQPMQQPQATRQGTRFPLPFGLGNKLGNKPGKRSANGQVPSQAQPREHTGILNRNKQPKQPTYRNLEPMDPRHNVNQVPAMVVPNAQFRPDLGQRSALPTVRNFGTYDSGHQEYDFENKKKQYPPFSEILATGRYFGSVEAQFLKPRFNGNSGLTISDTAGPGAGVVDQRVFDFDFEYLPHLQVGFESKYGPGLEIDFRQLRTASTVDSFTNAGGTSIATLTTSLPDPAIRASLSANAAGETLAATHTFNLETFGVSVFKEVQLPITRINGAFGMQFADIDQQVDADITNGAGATLRTLEMRSDMRAFGPKLRIEYFRPVGHTPVEFITSFGGSVMFGKRDQFIVGSDGTSFSRVGTDEIVSTFDFMSGIQMKQRIRENRVVFGRIGFINQVFNGGGSAVYPQDSFGLRGFSFLVGYNR